MSSFTSIESTSTINPTSTRRCRHGAYGPICSCTSNAAVASSSASTTTATEPSPAIKPASSSRRCRHGSYGPMCTCTSSSRSVAKATAPQTNANSDEQATASLGDHIRAVLKLKVHKRCTHGSYGPTCVCTRNVVA